MLLLGILAALLIFVAVIVYSSFSWGFVLFKFWYWFLIPVFSTAPQIDYWQAIGLMFIISLFNKVATEVSIKDEYLKTEEKTTVYTLGFLSPWITLVIGFIIHLIIN